MKARWILLSALVLGCTETRTRAPRLQSFRVSLESPAGTPENPLPFTAGSGQTFVVNVEAMGSSGELLTSHSGRVIVSVVPGEILGVQPSEPVVREGILTGLRVTIRKSYGPTHIWLEDGSGANPFAVGATPTLYFQNPRVSDVQRPISGIGRSGDSPLSGSSVTIDRGTNIVVHVSNNGFYVVDREEREFNSIFAFNFSRPEGLRRGDKLLRFGGNISEFLGLTEINFPSWDVDRRCPSERDPGQLCEEGEFCVAGACLGQECGDRVCAEGAVCMGDRCVPNPNIPDPVLNPPVLLAAEMEKYEGGLVRYTDVVTTQEFVNCDDPARNPGANGNGICEFCRTCNANRDPNGQCPSGGRCCPFPQLCNLSVGECTTRCDAQRDPEGACPTGKICCPAGNTCDEGLGMCNGCTIAQKAEAACDDACSMRGPSSPGGLCTNLCDFREFGQFRVGLTTAGHWNGASFLMVTADTVPFFRADAPENLGKRLRSVTGTLRNVFAPGPLWIVEPRDECDVDGIEHQRQDCDTVK
jgi:hypothetical protein